MADYLSGEPKEVLVIGNGFDVALGLPTQYMEFMEFLRIDDPVDMIEKVKSGADIKEEYQKFFGEVENIVIDEIKRMKELQKRNVWANYFLNCRAEIKGWIDLEREMLPVLAFIQWAMNQPIRMAGDGRGHRALFQTQEEEKYRMSKLLPMYVGREGAPVTHGVYSLCIQKEFCDIQHGVFKEKIIESLKQELEDFIEIFRIYLREIVDQVKKTNNPTINNLKADHIINFNYVKSEMFLPNLKDAETIHVHGDTTMPKNIVLGVNEVPDDTENNFLYFTKSFQRIKIKSNPHYRDFWEGSFNVTFFGHSLDVTDIDILKPLYEKAEHVRVFYYKEKDREEKILNLIKMTNIEQIENDNYSGRLELLPSGA